MSGLVHNSAFVMFCIFVAAMLVLTWWASAQTTRGGGFSAQSRTISGVQNGWAIAGDYLTAASFLGITGLIAFDGFDGFLYAVGWVVACLTLLLLIAEPLRNAGKYTLADLISFRLRGRTVRGIAAISTIVIAVLYLVAQLIAAGSLIDVLLPQINYPTAIALVGAALLIYVMTVGLLLTTWVQILKATLLFAAGIVLSILTLAHFGFSLGAFFDAAANVREVGGATVNLLQPGIAFAGSAGSWNALSLGLALVLGTAGLPHILMRFYTVPSARAARTSVAWAIVVIGVVLLSTIIMGLGAATIVGKAQIGSHLIEARAVDFLARHPGGHWTADFLKYNYLVPASNSNMAVPWLANALGGPYLMAFAAAAGFATILAVVAGLTISASSAFAHDIWWNIIRGAKGDEKEQMRVARAMALLVGVVSIALAMGLRSLNVAYIVGLAFAVAASANVPTIALSLLWRRFNHFGAVTGMIAGLVCALVLIAISPAVMGFDVPGAGHHHLLQMNPIFPLENPGIVSIPLGFLGAILGTLAQRDLDAEREFTQLQVRANTGMGAEV